MCVCLGEGGGGSKSFSGSTDNSEYQPITIMRDCRLSLLENLKDIKLENVEIANNPLVHYHIK